MPFFAMRKVMTMLRVSYSDTSDGQRWSLCGRLAGPWVDELRTCWREARQRAPRARAVVDLKDVVFIDEAGGDLLAEMKTSGAELVAAGVENQHVIATLKCGVAGSLRRRLEHGREGCGDKESTPKRGEN